MTNRLYLFALFIGTITAGCGSNETKAPASAPVAKKPVITAPFRFQKTIEVAPGQSYDILSWGRGAEDAGAYMILHSDSAAIKYITTTGDLDGAIVDVFNTDMDVDGNPEIIIQARSKDTTRYNNIYAFEFSDSKANKLDFPRLNNSQRKGYRGQDKFYITDGKLMREFPIYEGSGKDAKPTGAKRQLEYGLHSNEFTVQQISKDSTAVADKKPSSASGTAAISKSDDNGSAAKKTERKGSSSSSKSKKKRHRRHNSD